MFFSKKSFTIFLWLLILISGLTFGLYSVKEVAENASKILDHKRPGVDLYWRHTFQFIALVITSAIIIFYKKENKKYSEPLFFILIFFVFDYFHNNYSLYGKYYFSFCYFCLSIFCLFLGLTKRSYASFFITAFLLAGIYFISLLKEHFLYAPLGLGDIAIFFHNFWANFSLAFIYPKIGIPIVGSLLIGAITIWLFFKFEKPTIQGSLLKTAVIQILLITWSVAALYFYRPLSDFGKNKDNLTINNIVEYLDFLTIQTVERPASQYDPVLRIISFVHHKTLIADIPPPVAASEYTQFNQSVSTYQAGSIRPDIMMVLVESAFDPTLVGTCIDQSCTRYGYMSGFSGRNEQNPMLVHTVGGRTWLSEFAFFTGFDYRFFRASGVLAPLVLAPELKKSLVTHLKQIGYRTVAIYAIDGNFLDARKIYEHYGIDEFYSLSELRRLGDDQGDSRAMTFANWEKVTDREVYSHALDISKTKDDGRPLFLFVLTIRNHSPWQAAFSLDLAKVLNGSTPNPPLDDYTAKLKDTDTDFASLINTWFSSDRPRVLGWFGDHQPHTTTQPPLPGHTLDARIAEQYRKYPQYFTFYGLFANYPVEVTDKDPQMLDIAFLGQRMLKFAGLPLPDDLIGADRVIEACSGALYDCPDKKLINAYVAKRIYVDGVLKTD